ncbi:SpvB/TcaC N-terminal domain-containing protein [Pseudoalteromonas sp. SSDWG2]|uniref:FG-GAP repeat domain-containing protein n=1 Tax=Pseudoalteromonas sp. SSDWG2 TaxID=3139391 RepID=UPI003BA85D8F
MQRISALRILFATILSTATASSSVLASESGSVWLPIGTGDTTTIVPLPRVALSGNAPYSASTTQGDLYINVEDIGASKAFYFRTKDAVTGSYGAWQCQSAEQVAASNNQIVIDNYIAQGTYSFEVSACMTGEGCDVSAFTQGNLACSGYAQTTDVEIGDVQGTRPLQTKTSNLNDEHVGTINAEFRVNEQGAATYNVPITLPPGTAGVQPQLALSYNSLGGDGIMGRGWNVSGLESISRCGKSFVFDDEQGGVDLSTNDRLCINGQRLILSDTTDAPHDFDKNHQDAQYWATTAEYHTAIDGFITVKPHYNGGSLRGFTVENKAGEVRYFGDVSQFNGTSLVGKSFATGFKNSLGINETGYNDAFLKAKTNANAAHAWLLKAIEDVKGNYILYRYSDFSKYDDHLGESRIESIEYTGNRYVADATPYAVIKFVYTKGNETDDKNHAKPRVGWRAGSPYAMTSMLRSIDVTIDGAEYRHYTLGYYESTYMDERSYLESIQECDGQECSAVMTFEWQKSAPITTNTEEYCTVEDTTPKSIQCWEQPVTDPFKPFQSTNSKVASHSKVGNGFVFDFNGDGYADIVYPNSGWRVSYGPHYYSNEVITGITALDDKAQHAQIIDYNGDGVLDLLVAESSTKNWYALTSVPEKSSEYDERIGEVVTTSKKAINLGIVAKGLTTSAQVADVDGDGLQDIVYHTTDSGPAFYYYKNIKDGYFAPSQLLFSVPISGAAMYRYDRVLHSISSSNGLHEKTAEAKNATVLDFDGDGITDLLFAVKSQGRTCDDGGMEPFSTDPSVQSDTTQNDTFQSDTKGNKQGKSKGAGGLNDGGVTTQAINSCIWEDIYAEWLLYSGKDWSQPADKLSYYSITKPRAVDLNGDGLTDIMWRAGSTLKYRISNGVSFEDTQTAVVSNSNGYEYTLAFSEDQEKNSYFMDVSRDGISDLLISDATSSYSGDDWSMYMVMPLPSNPSKVVFQRRGTYSFEKDRGMQFGDADGDGKLDLFSMDTDKVNVRLS